MRTWRHTIYFADVISDNFFIPLLLIFDAHLQISLIKRFQITFGVMRKVVKTTKITPETIKNICRFALNKKNLILINTCWWKLRFMTIWHGNYDKVLWQFFLVISLWYCFISDWYEIILIRYYFGKCYFNGFERIWMLAWMKGADRMLDRMLD